MSVAPFAARVITFRVGTHLFAADIGSVERVLRFEGVRLIPDLPDWMAGVVDHAGAAVPAIDLRRRFGLPAPEPGPQARLVVCVSQGSRAALLVDAVLDVRPVAAGDLADPPALFRGLAAEYLRGLMRRQGDLVVVLDIDRLLASTESLELAAAIPGEVPPA